jgi:hypothetical protein
MSEELRFRVRCLHDEIEWLAAQAAPPVDPADVTVREVVARALPGLLDVSGGLNLIEGLAAAGMPLPDEVVRRWAVMLAKSVPRWAPLIDPDSFDELMAAPALQTINWGLARVYCTVAQGLAIHEAGDGWLEWEPDWGDVPSPLQRRALELYAGALDPLLQLLGSYDGDEIYRALRALKQVVTELVPEANGEGLPQWRWLAARVSMTEAVDGLYAAEVVAAEIEQAFMALPVPDAPAEAAGVLEILALRLPDCLLSDGLGDRRRALEARLGVGDLSGLPPATIKRKLARAVKALSPPSADEDLL